jgi:predicted MFS family arabinose efflux permease
MGLPDESAASRDALPSEWRKGGKIVLAAACGAGTFSFYAYSLGSFIAPLSQQLGWSRGTITAAFFFPAIAGLVAGPWIGTLVDRYGTRRVGLPGILLYGAALAAIGLCPPYPVAWYIAWAVAGFLFMGCSPILWTRAVAMQFDKQRGLALALTMSSAGVVNAGLPIFTVTMIEWFGWRGAYFALGGLAVLLSFPINWMLMQGTSASARKPDGAAVPAAAPPPPSLPGLTLGECLRGFLFWRLVLALGLVAAAIGTLTIHTQPILTDAGMTAQQAAGFVALFGPSLIVGRLSGGLLVDRFDARFIAALAFLLPAVACMALVGFDGSYRAAIVAPVCAGLAAGVQTNLIAYLVTRYFGMRSYGAVFGILFGLFGVATTLSPVVAGAVFDSVGSYDMVLRILSAMSVAGALLMVSLGRYPVFKDQN